MAKETFWKNKELLRRNVRPRTKLKILNYYTFSVPNYGCECWTWNKAMLKRINAFEQWCLQKDVENKLERQSNYRRCSEQNLNKTACYERYEKRKLEYSGHVLRGSSGKTHLILLEGKISGKRANGRPRVTWLENIIDWTKIDSYEKIKKTDKKD